MGSDKSSYTQYFFIDCSFTFKKKSEKKWQKQEKHDGSAIIANRARVNFNTSEFSLEVLRICFPMSD